MIDSDPPCFRSFPEDAFDAAVTEVLRKDNPHAYSTITFIQRCLMQYNLATRLEACDILNEAYIRGKEFISSGKTIRNPHSWLKSTSLNIIREMSRKQKKEQPISTELADSSPVTDSLITPEDINHRWEELLSTFQRFSHIDPDGARLLNLKAQGLSWKEIHERITQEDGEVKSESALRQQACRAKKHLRKIYHSTTTDAANLPIS